MKDAAERGLRAALGERTPLLDMQLQVLQGQQVKRTGAPLLAGRNLAMFAGFTSWFAFLTTGLMMMYLFQQLSALVEFVVVVGSGTCLVGAVLSRSHGEAYALFLIACTAIFGSIVGGYNYAVNVSDYWAFNSHRQYTNVWPDESAAAHRDASAMVFAEGSRPDPKLAASYFSGTRSYCVAPVSMKYAALTTTDVQYWAVGADCCKGAGGANFACGDALIPSARSGMVVYERSSFFHDLSIQETTFYHQAVEMAKARHNIRSAEHPVFVRWVKDLDMGRQAFWSAAWSFWGQAALISLPVCLLMGAFAPFLTPRRGEGQFPSL